MKRILFAAMTVILLLAATGCNNIRIGPYHNNGGGGSDPVTTVPYLTFKGNEAFTLGINPIYGSVSWDGTVEYSTNKENWTVWDGKTINSAASDGSNCIYLRGKDNTTFCKTAYTVFVLGVSTTLEVECIGNIMTLLDYSSPDTANMGNYCFCLLFLNCDKLIKAPDLPATTLSTYCYNLMFSGCTALKDAPNLPATILNTGCYNSMFYGCTSLKAAPALPATTLATVCYTNMFFNCQALTTAHSLPATTLTDNCYASMFSNCQALKTSPAILATTLAKECCKGMFQGCTALQSVGTIANGNSVNVDGKSSCFTDMFSGCTALNLKEEDASTATGYFVKLDGASTEVSTNCSKMFDKTKGFSGTPAAGKAYKFQ